MPRKNDSWGIEIGANAIKAMRLMRHGNRIELAEYEVLPFRHILTTPDLNVDEAVQVNLDAFLARHDLAKTSVIVSVPGHMAFARFAKLPPVEPKKIPDIVRFEAVQQIPFPIDQVEWDYQVFQQEDSPDVEVGIFAITKERVLSFLNNLRQVGLELDALTLSPLAVYNAFSYEAEGESEPEGTIYMDVGSQCTDVIIVESGGIWLRTLPIGGNNFTDALVRAFKLSFAKAEKLKREAGTSKYARQIFQAMRPVFADLVQEMQRSLGYYQSLNREAKLARLVGVGSTFRLPGLQKFLKQQLQIEVSRPDGFKRIAVEGKREADFAENALNLATAYGLALQGLGMEQVSANILPGHIIKQRLWRAKQPWIVAAAACVAIGVGLAGARYFVESASNRAAVGDSNKKVNPIIRRAEKFGDQMRRITEGTDPRMRIENLRRILDYRDVWPKLLEDISLATLALTPQTETLGANYEAIGNIPRSQRRRFYIESVTAEYLVQQHGGQPAPSGFDRAMHAGMGNLMPSLAADNVFAVHTVDDFWPQDAPSGDGGSANSADAAPEEPAQGPRFVIRVRGTTPHSDGAKFLSDQFIRWLQENAERKNRPYRLAVDTDTVIWDTWPLGEATYPERPRSTMSSRGRGSGQRTRGRTGRRPYEAGPAPGLPAGYALGLRGGGVPGAPGLEGSMGRSRGGTRTRLVGGTFEQLLPERPLAEEDRDGDLGVEILWTVQLLRPEEARRAEQPAAPLSPEPTDGGAPEQAGRSHPVDPEEARS